TRLVKQQDRRASLEAQVASFPTTPGVYLFKDAKGRVLYVGKADSLRDRVRNYFGPSLDVRFVRLVERAERVEYVLTGSISESYLLENNLIKQHKPRYNIRLKDDKSYPYVKITLGEDFPRILRTRILGDRSARYFGPFANAKSVDESLDLLQKLFPYRTCKLRIDAGDDGRGKTVPPSALSIARRCTRTRATISTCSPPRSMKVTPSYRSSACATARSSAAITSRSKDRRAHRRRTSSRRSSACTTAPPARCRPRSSRRSRCPRPNSSRPYSASDGAVRCASSSRSAGGSGISRSSRRVTRQTRWSRSACAGSPIAGRPRPRSWSCRRRSASRVRRSALSVTT